MKSKDDDNPSHEFSLPSEIVKVSRPARVNMRQPVPRDIQVPSNGDEPAEKIDFARYLHAVRRNWLLGAVLGILCSAPLAALVWFLNPKQYTATEYLRISHNVAPLVFQTSENRSRIDVDSFKKTQAQLILQPLSLSKALKESDMMTSPIIAEKSDAIGWLQKQIKVTFPDKAEIMNVSLTLTDPVAAHKIVKAVVDTYMQDHVAKDKLDRQQRVDQMEKILAAQDAKINRKRSELSNIAEATGSSDTSTINLAQQSTLQHYTLLRQELSKTEFEIARLKGELELMKSTESPEAENLSQVTRKPELQADAGGKPSETDAGTATSTDSEKANPPSSEISDVRLLEALENDPQASHWMGQIDRLQKTIASTEKRYDPKIAASYTTKYRKQLDEAKEKLASRQKRIEQLHDIGATSTSNQSRPDNLPRRIGILTRQYELLKTEMTKLEAESRGFGRKSIDVENKRKEIDRLEPVVLKVSQEIEQTKIEMDSASRVIPLQSTGVPVAGENKKRLPMTAGAGLFGLFFPIGLLAFLDSRKNRVNNVFTINNGLKLTVLGSVPRIPNRMIPRLNDPQNSGAKVWRDRISESMSAVTAMLLRKFAVEGHRVIMISSARSGEGKSTLCEQLARSLAASGHRTLLIDFDLRRPNLNLRFDVPLEPGVTEVLRHGAELMQTVRQTDFPNLCLLTAGNTGGSLLLESANGSLEALFNQCRTEFELVLVDTSPLLPVVDGRLVGQHTDGAILTIVKDTSQVPQVMTARKILEDYGIAELGCVFTGDQAEDGYYGGNGTYGSYGRLPGSAAPALENKSTRPTSAM